LITCKGDYVQKWGNKACQVQDLTCSISTNIGNVTVLRKGEHANILSWYVVRANTVRKGDYNNTHREQIDCRWYSYCIL